MSGNSLSVVAQQHTERGIFFQFYLAVHSVQLVVEGHSEVGGGAGGHVGDKGRLALVDCVIHVDTTLADLHVLEARLHTAWTDNDGDRQGMSAVSCETVAVVISRFKMLIT